MTDTPKNKGGRPPSGKVPILIRINAYTVELLDRNRGDVSRAEWLEAAFIRDHERSASKTQMTRFAKAQVNAAARAMLDSGFKFPKAAPGSRLKKR